MLAVIAAFLVSWLQARSAVKVRRLDTLEQLDALTKVVEIARDRVRELYAQLLMAPVNHGIKFANIPLLQKVETAFEAVNALSIGMAPSAKSVGALLDAKTAIRHADGIVPNLNTESGRAGQFFDTHDAELKSIADLLAEAEVVMREEWHRLSQAV